MAFANSGVSAAHALQFALGALTHTSHGLGTGVLLPYVMEFNRPVRETELAELSRVMGGDAVTFTHELGMRIGLPASLARIGVTEADLRPMAEASLPIKRLIDNNPRPLDVDSLEAILTAAWHGEPSRLAPIAA
jgi:alcohol dehydrogenase